MASFICHMFGGTKRFRLRKTTNAPTQRPEPCRFNALLGISHAGTKNLTTSASIPVVVLAIVVLEQ